MGSIDDRTFSSNFTGDGIQKLRDEVGEKLKEFMGEYTDDALVEYVIVLLKNGRRKEEAKNELNVFLGDDSDSFVSWLWDHLAANISLYVEPCADEVIKLKPSSATKLERNNKRDSESDKAESKSRHSREWKGLAKDASDPPPLRSSDIEIDRRSRERGRRSRRSPSPRRDEDKKRSRIEDRQEYKREASGASRRLLQFAVRDAMANPGPTPEASLKRLRSVVSMPNDDSSVVEHPRRIKSVARVPNGMASVIKAVAEAAEDSVRVKSSANVFDRLGRETESHIEPASYEKASIEDIQFGDLHIQKRSMYLQRRRQNVGNMTELKKDAFGGETEGYDGVDASDIYVHPSGGNKGEKLMMMDKSGVDATRKNMYQDKPAIAITTKKTSQHISGNANTWKPPQYQAAEVGGHRGAPTSGIPRISDVTVNGNAKADALSQKAAQPTSGDVVEDVESRTVFVSNVHFGATKDGLSCHFNKFGEVVKVVIVRDAATGQPVGSAYVEFTRKESADNALSLDATSFMSRLLKVVKKSGGGQQQQETAVMVWPPRATRGRRAASPFQRGRANPRSFQWKRQDASASASASAPRGGGLTYVRTKAKTS